MVTVFLANGFEEMEALAPVDLLRRAGVPVQTAAVGTAPGSHGGKVVTGAHGVTFLCDITADQVSEDDMEMLVLPGGGEGTENLGKSVQVDALLQTAIRKGAYIGAICAAPSILGEKGMLCGKNATAYPGCEPKGAICCGEAVVKDGTFITAKGPGVSLEFALELIACLKGSQAAQKVKGEIQWQK